MIEWQVRRFVLVGEPEIQKSKKSGRKVAEFYTISCVSMMFQKCETDIAQILSLAKDVYLWGNHSYPHAGFM